MLSRLTGTRRTTAGRLLALVYLFCVLAPAMSFAFADGARAAPCLTEDKLGMGIVHVHEHVGAVAHRLAEVLTVHDASRNLVDAPGDVRGRGQRVGTVGEASVAESAHAGGPIMSCRSG